MDKLEESRISKFATDNKVSYEIARDWCEAFSSIGAIGLETHYFKMFGKEINPYILAKQYGYL